MNLHNLMPACAAVALITLAQIQFGQAADYRMRAQTSAASYRQYQPQDDDEDYSAEPKPLAASLCECEAGCGDACPGSSCFTQSGACCGRCDTCCPDACCGPYIRKQIFAEYLYLRPLNANVEYAVPFNGPISAGAVPLQEGRTASVNPVFSSGFRAGGGLWFDDCTGITATFSHYENNSYDATSVDPPLVLRAMVIHPSSLDADEDWLSASAHQYIRFDLGDLDYRHEFYSSECSSVDYLVGIRYAGLRQEFDAQYESIITGNVNTQVNFDGGGLRFGLEAQRYGARNISVYGKASASFLGGEFRGTYLQSDTNLPVVTQTDWKEARFVSILDCEVGIYWTSRNNRLRASAGYMLSGWMNVVKTAEFISSVQANQYHGPDKINGNGLVFDGFVASLEYNW
jgi:Legionella pneumophila major outer membrane protein precursor